MKSKTRMGLAAVALLAVAGAAEAAPSTTAAGAAAPGAVDASAVLEQVRHRRGFQVWSLGPYPSGFGDERRTGRPFIAGRSYGYRHIYRYRRW